LWAINDEQGVIAARLSPSPVVNEAFDFNAALLTPDGRCLYSGVYIVQHASTIDVFVRELLDTWDAPEIREGDMFFTNDPWSGALHANDGILASPVFWHGDIVCWAGIVMHDDDVGSPVPGSWVVGAEDRFGEGPLFPPIKIAEGFELRADIERAYARNHRTPQVTMLNLRARLASLRITNRRIHELIDRYGLETFKACQEQIIEHVEKVTRQRLRDIPDGSWTAQVYHDHDGRQNTLYPVKCRLEKRGDSLTLDFAGSAPQATGAVNCALPALEGAVFGTFLTVFCFDVPWSVGALRRIITIRSEEGTIVNASSPAAVSMASVAAMLSASDVVMAVYGKMLLASPELRSEAQAVWSPGATIVVMGGTNRRGEPFTHMFMDSAAGGGGARTFGDGIDTGGGFASMSFAIPNVETTENRAPVLELFRRQSRDSCGHGRWRGGAGVQFAVLPHKTDAPIATVIVASGVSQPGAPGLSGGAPASVKANIVYRGSDIRQRLDAGVAPDQDTTWRASAVETRAAKDFLTLSEDDVLVSLVCGGCGFGDPLRRDSPLVAEDVRAGLVSEAIAHSVYGVVLKDGKADPDATDQARRRIRAERLREGKPATGTVRERDVLVGGTVIQRVADTVELVESDAGRSLRCTECEHRFGDSGCDYKLASLVRDLPLNSLSELNSTGLIAEVVLCEFCCPGCGTLVAVDVQLRGEPTIDEAQLEALAR
jgi:N-methylhydantoinase B/oxoprolinase/acetone carboxylase alpha subunit